MDGEIVSLLRQRYKECIIYEQPDHKLKCKKLQEDFEEASENFFIKCKIPFLIKDIPTFILKSNSFFSHFKDGDLGPHNNVVGAYMKQKHRLLWERRNGPVGTGMKNQEALSHWKE